MFGHKSWDAMIDHSTPNQGVCQVFVTYWKCFLLLGNGGHLPQTKRGIFPTVKQQQQSQPQPQTTAITTTTPTKLQKTSFQFGSLSSMASFADQIKYISNFTALKNMSVRDLRTADIVPLGCDSNAGKMLDGKRFQRFLLLWLFSLLPGFWILFCKLSFHGLSKERMHMSWSC